MLSAGTRQVIFGWVSGCQLNGQSLNGKLSIPLQNMASRKAQIIRGLFIIVQNVSGLRWFLFWSGTLRYAGFCCGLDHWEL